MSNAASYLANVEVLAEMFRAETGMWAPGKSVPLECGEPHTQEQRAEAYRVWYRDKALDSALTRLLHAEHQLERACEVIDNGGLK